MPLQDEVLAAEREEAIQTKREIGRAVSVRVELEVGVSVHLLETELPGGSSKGHGTDEGEGLIAVLAAVRIQEAEVDEIALAAVEVRDALDVR